ncbi:MAG: response regulator [Anaerolineae bacterium]
MSTESATILVVDDNDLNRELVVRQLEKQGHEAAQAENGQQAMEMMRQRPFDLVLLDIMMPVMNGYQVLEEMQADDELRYLPVIVVSAVNEMDSIVRCIELGAEDHLPKPVSRVLLRARIMAALEKKRWRDRERAYLRTIEATSVAKSRFITAVAHELKNTITPIRGYTDLLRAGAFGPISEAQAGVLEIMHTNAKRTNALVADLSDISRIESGKLQMDLRPISMAEIVGDVVSAMKAQTEAKNQTVDVAVPADLPAVQADDVRLAQVLTNLVSNAQKYTPREGTIRIWAEQVVHQCDGDGPARFVHVTVEDTGIGIAAEEHEQIFQAFFRSTDQAVVQTPGVGLGLSITRDLVELLGGCIWFESEYGQGTTFHFTMPVAEAA